MKIIHFSDVHLGYARFGRVTPTGANQRTQDVEDAFARLITHTIAARADVVLVSGDLFHQPHPATGPVLAAYRGFRRLRAALPDAMIVVAAGNHEIAPVAHHPCILQLLADVGVHVADRTAQRFRDPSRGLAILAVPECATRGADLTPDPDAATNLLVIHGEVMGAVDYQPADVLATIDPERLEDPRWAYVALGHYHTFTRVAARAYYAGAIEYTSSNPWREIGTPHGLIAYDTTTPDVPPHLVEIPGARRHLDLPPIDAAELSAAELNAALGERIAAAPGGIHGAVVRCVVTGVRHEMRRQIDQKALRRYQAEALHLLLDLRRADPHAAITTGLMALPVDAERNTDWTYPELDEAASAPDPAMLAEADALIADLAQYDPHDPVIAARIAAVNRWYMGEPEPAHAA